MKALYKSVVVISCLSALVACAPPKDKNSAVTTIDAQNTVMLDTQAVMRDASLSPVQKAERLALIAEQMMTPTGFFYASEILDQALTLDAANKRAQLYKAFAATPMALRGILARVKPISYARDNTRRDHEGIVRSLPDSPLKTFLLDGNEDIRTEKDIQSFATSIYEAQNQFRNFLKENKDLQINIRVNSWHALNTPTQTLADCSIRKISEGVYDIRQCGLIQTTQYQLTRADLETLQQLTAGWQIYLAVWIAYDVTGALEVSEKYRGRQVTRATAYQELIQNQDFGKLNNPQILRNILSMGTDAVAGARWAMQFNNEMCTGSGSARTGLFGVATCNQNVKNDSSRLDGIFRSVDAALSGQNISLQIGRQQTEIQARPTAILERPIADLKTLDLTFNRCDKLSSVTDGTVGGLFPDDNINEILQADAACE